MLVNKPLPRRMPLMFLGDWNINLVAAEKVPPHLGQPNELKLLGEFAAKGLVLCEEGFPDTRESEERGASVNYLPGNLYPSALATDPVALLQYGDFVSSLSEQGGSG
jgi:hypothetical protein